jgi:hypothetical protein
MTKIMTEEEEDLAAQAAIRSGANKALSIIEKGFIHNGSGRYFVLRTKEIETDKYFKQLEAVDD